MDWTFMEKSLGPATVLFYSAPDPQECEIALRAKPYEKEACLQSVKFVVSTA